MEQNQEGMSSNRIQNGVLGKKKNKLSSYEAEKETRVTLQEIIPEFTWNSINLRQMAKKDQEKEALHKRFGVHILKEREMFMQVIKWKFSFEVTKLQQFLQVLSIAFIPFFLESKTYSLKSTYITLGLCGYNLDNVVFGCQK